MTEKQTAKEFLQQKAIKETEKTKWHRCHSISPEDIARLDAVYFLAILLFVLGVFIFYVKVFILGGV